MVHSADNLATIVCLFSRNSVSPNLLEPKGPAQACTGIALRLYHCVLHI